MVIMSACGKCGILNDCIRRSGSLELSCLCLLGDMHISLDSSHEVGHEDWEMHQKLHWLQPRSQKSQASEGPLLGPRHPPQQTQPPEQQSVLRMLLMLQQHTHGISLTQELRPLHPLSLQCTAPALAAERRTLDCPMRGECRGFLQTHCMGWKLGTQQQVCIALSEGELWVDIERQRIDAARGCLCVTLCLQRPHNRAQQPCAETDTLDNS